MRELASIKYMLAVCPWVLTLLMCESDRRCVVQRDINTRSIKPKMNFIAKSLDKNCSYSAPSYITDVFM